MKLYRVTAKKTLLKMRLPVGAFIFVMLLILALGGAGIYWFNSNFNPAALTTLQNMIPVTSEPVSLTLNLSSPEDNSLVFSEDLLIQGKTSPKAVVILSTNSSDLLLEPTPQGDFSVSVKLQPGLNLLSINAFDQAGIQKTENRTIYYSEEKI